MEIAPRAADGGVGLSAVAFAEIYGQHMPELTRYCRRILRDSHDAEDAAQSAMERALAALETAARRGGCARGCSPSPSARRSRSCGGGREPVRPRSARRPTSRSRRWTRWPPCASASRSCWGTFRNWHRASATCWLPRARRPLLPRHRARARHDRGDTQQIVLEARHRFATSTPAARSVQPGPDAALDHPRAHPDAPRAGAHARLRLLPLVRGRDPRPAP